MPYVYKLARQLKEIYEKATLCITLAWEFKRICSVSPMWLSFNNVHAFLATSTGAQMSYLKVLIGVKQCSTKICGDSTSQSLLGVHIRALFLWPPNLRLHVNLWVLSVNIISDGHIWRLYSIWDLKRGKSTIYDIMPMTNSAIVKKRRTQEMEMFPSLVKAGLTSKKIPIILQRKEFILYRHKNI